MSFWLKHGQFTQNLSFARDLCITAGLKAEKGEKERTPSTESYLMLGRAEDSMRWATCAKPSVNVIILYPAELQSS